MIEIYLLCVIANQGGSTNSCLLCGANAPVSPPACTCALAYATSNATFYYWDAGLAAWVTLIGP